MSEMTPFSYINDINSYKRVIDKVDSKYSQFLVNRNFSLFSDTIFASNMGNQLNNIPDDIHFLFMKSAIKAKKRFSGKWPKPKENDKINKISIYYGISKAKASEIEIFFSDSDIDAMDLKK